MTTTVYIKEQNFTNPEGESIDYKRLAISGEINGEDQEILLRLNKLDMLIAEMILSSNGAKVQYIPVVGLRLQGLVNGRSEYLEVDLDKSEALICKILFAADNGLPASNAGNANQSSPDDFLEDKSGRSAEDNKIDLDEE